ncbi:hypothetical protein BCR36DRAFT_371205 [Piromyces finnis]|uniref:Uncharacterized protein n=1 Tax=Piromyces finnis TaxID=1754191 RepID=A0A1Y1V734_9FUNG|nr:hypothetical protein BCR36DRAFT_371205 [Piromyces finnis]|eukprot:ORX48716.1 hypothetical protein BCR36DRAFT_371205 [Piromyces finnis]
MTDKIRNSKVESMEVDLHPTTINEIEEVYHNPSSSEGALSAVEQYLNNLTDDTPDNQTLETQNKNRYGGNSQIRSYNPSNSSAIAGITENKNQIEAMRLQIANKAENVEVQQLANVIDKNTVKPFDLTTVVGEVKEEIHNNKMSSAKVSDLIPIEHELNEQGKNIDFIRSVIYSFSLVTGLVTPS